MKSFVSERGQITVPPRLWYDLHMEVGQLVKWEQISATEFRMTLLPAEEVKPDPVAALNFAHDYGLVQGSSDAALKELREGEED